MKRDVCGLSLLVVAFIIWIVLGVIGAIIAIIQFDMLSDQEEKACNELGYNFYNSGNELCISSGKYIPVYMICDKAFLSPSCEAFPFGVGE